jgi:hypothetical protein
MLGCNARTARAPPPPELEHAAPKPEPIEIYDLGLDAKMVKFVLLDVQSCADGEHGEAGE